LKKLLHRLQTLGIQVDIFFQNALTSAACVKLNKKYVLDLPFPIDVYFYLFITVMPK
jgi:hypothetical protein